MLSIQYSLALPFPVSFMQTVLAPAPHKDQRVPFSFTAALW